MSHTRCWKQCWAVMLMAGQIGGCTGWRLETRHELLTDVIGKRFGEGFCRLPGLFDDGVGGRGARLGRLGKRGLAGCGRGWRWVGRGRGCGSFRAGDFSSRRWFARGGSAAAERGWAWIIRISWGWG